MHNVQEFVRAVILDSQNPFDVLPSNPSLGRRVGSVFTKILLLMAIFAVIGVFEYIAFHLGGWGAAAILAALVLAGVVSGSKSGKKYIIPTLKIGGTLIVGWYLASSLLPIVSVGRLIGALIILAVFVFIVSCLFDHEWI